MTKEEQILAGIEEIANQLNEIKKITKSNETKGNIDLTGLTASINKIDGFIKANNSASTNSEGYFKEITLSIQRLTNVANTQRSSVDIKYIEIKNSFNWILGALVYFFISAASIFLLIQYSNNTKEKLFVAKRNDIKYRLLKIENEPLSKLRNVAANTTELTYYIDSLYELDPKAMEEYVLKSENQIHIAFEAAEIAKQKEAEARAAREKATN